MMTVLGLFLAAAVQAAMPLLFATLGEIITEKAGNINLGVEGMMLMGAVIGFSAGLATSDPLIAIMSAAVAGAAGALIYAFLTVTLRANQIVSGLALTIFGVGFSGFTGQKLVGQVMPDSIKAFFTPLGIPLFEKIPFIGPVLFHQDIFIYFGFIVTIGVGLYFYKTGSGLNLRAVGENPAAADAAGIRVNLVKYFHILAGGALCGLGGAYLSLVYVPAWQDNVTAGRGWIAVALVIFTSWNPYKALIGALLFGGLDIIGFRLQKYNISISQYIIDMLPYAVTVIALVVMSMRKSRENGPPKGLGNSYFREDR